MEDQFSSWYKTTGKSKFWNFREYIMDGKWIIEWISGINLLFVLTAYIIPICYYDSRYLNTLTLSYFKAIY
jgi:hypothetical protein